LSTNISNEILRRCGKDSVDTDRGQPEDDANVIAGVIKDLSKVKRKGRVLKYGTVSQKKPSRNFEVHVLHKALEPGSFRLPFKYKTLC